MISRTITVRNAPDACARIHVHSSQPAVRRFRERKAVNRKSRRFRLNSLFGVVPMLDLFGRFMRDPVRHRRVRVGGLRQPVCAELPPGRGIVDAGFRIECAGVPVG